MNTEDCKSWLLQRLEKQINAAKKWEEVYLGRVKDRMPMQNIAEAKREMIYWFDRIENTQRCIEELSND